MSRLLARLGLKARLASESGADEIMEPESIGHDGAPVAVNGGHAPRAEVVS
jgi:hypothetical protein